MLKVTSISALRSERVHDLQKVKSCNMPPKSLLWQEVRVLSEKDAHYNVDMECRHCKLEFSGGANRIAHHLAATGLGISACENCPPETSADAKKALSKTQLAKKLKVSHMSRSHSDSEIDLTEPSSSSQASKAASAGTHSLKTLFGKQAKKEVMPAVIPAGLQCDLCSKCSQFIWFYGAQVDRAVARFFYATGTSFNRLLSPYFDEMLAAVAKYGPSYHKPNVNQLREGLLAAEVQRVEAELANTVLDQIETTGGTATSDGWTAVDNRPLLNALLVTPKGACFRTAIDTSGKVKAMPPAACFSRRPFAYLLL